MGVTELEFHALLDHFCDFTLALLTSFQSQVVTSMEVPATLRFKGAEEPYWMGEPMFRVLYQSDLETDGSSIESIADTAPTVDEPLFAAAGSVADV